MADPRLHIVQFIARRTSDRVITSPPYRYCVQTQRQLNDDMTTNSSRLSFDPPVDYAGCSVFNPNSCVQLRSHLCETHIVWQGLEGRPLKRYRMAWNQFYPASTATAQQERFDNFRVSMRSFEAHFHATEPNCLQRWNHQGDYDIPDVWTDSMYKLMMGTINPSIEKLYEDWQTDREIGYLWAGLGALHWHLIRFQRTHVVTAGLSFIWSFPGNPLDFESQRCVRYQHPDHSVLIMVHGVEGEPNPNPETCTFRDIAIHTVLLARMDNLFFH